MTRARLLPLMFLLAGCSPSPLSPTSAATATVTDLSQDAKPDHSAGTLKVTIYFYSDDIGLGGNVHVIGVPVALTSVPASVAVTTTTNRQATVSIDVPKSTTAVTWAILPNSLGYCVASGTLNLPYLVRDNWFLVHRACAQ